MPAVQYRDEVNKIEITRRMPTPKKVSSIDHWYKASRKLIPEIPDHFVVRNTFATEAYVRFELVSNAGAKAHIVIDRKAPAIG